MTGPASAISVSPSHSRRYRDVRDAGARERAFDVRGLQRSRGKNGALHDRELRLSLQYPIWRQQRPESCDSLGGCLVGNGLLSRGPRLHDEHRRDLFGHAFAVDLHDGDAAEHQPIPHLLRERARPRQCGEHETGCRGEQPYTAAARRRPALTRAQLRTRANDVGLRLVRGLQRVEPFVDPITIVRVAIVRHSVSRTPSGMPPSRGSAAFQQMQD